MTTTCQHVWACVCPLQPQICSDTAGLTDDDKKKRRSLSFTLPQSTCTGAVQPLTLEMGRATLCRTRFN